jgi:uncharacterized protein (UPF0335 family)
MGLDGNDTVPDEKAVDEKVPDEKAGEIVDGEGIAAEQLGRFVDRVERLEEEKSAIGTNIKEVYAEAKSQGFDPKIMRKIVRLRTMDPHEVDEEEAMIHLYKQALGMS